MERGRTGNCENCENGLRKAARACSMGGQQQIARRAAVGGGEDAGWKKETVEIGDGSWEGARKKRGKETVGNKIG